jgi:hypothetical protein
LNLNNKNNGFELKGKVFWEIVSTVEGLMSLGVDGYRDLSVWQLGS